MKYFDWCSEEHMVQCITETADTQISHDCPPPLRSNPPRNVDVVSFEEDWRMLLELMGCSAPCNISSVLSDRSPTNRGALGIQTGR